MRYVVESRQGGFAVIDSHLGLPVTLSQTLQKTTPSEETASHYADKLNECAELLGIANLSNSS